MAGTVAKNRLESKEKVKDSPEVKAVKRKKGSVDLQTKVQICDLKKAAKKGIGKEKKIYKKEYCDLVVDRMREGYSMYWVCREIHIKQDTFFEWIKEHLEFGEAYSLARTLCNAWWSEQGRLHLGQRGFQSTLWLMNMRNRFGWHEGKPHFPLVEIEGFEQPSLRAKAEAAAIAVAKKKISADHYLCLMQALQCHAAVIDKTETSERLEVVERYIMGDKKEAENFPNAEQAAAVE